MNVLAKITAERRADAVRAARAVPAAALLRLAEKRTHHSLVERLRAGGGTRIIAEVKKASPSAGVLREEYRPDDMALAYRDAGAAAISVLTEPRYFLGGRDHLEAVRRAVDLPILRKDFLSDEYQVIEAAAWGADAVLLIVAAVEAGTLRRLHRAAADLGLDVLVEAHTAREVRAAVGLEGAIVGVNSRDLKTLKTDLSIAFGLAASIPAGRLGVAESGIRNRTDVAALEAAGYRGFLVGEALLRSDDPGAALRVLIGHER